MTLNAVVSLSWSFSQRLDFKILKGFLTFMILIQLLLCTSGQSYCSFLIFRKVNNFISEQSYDVVLAGEYSFLGRSRHT